MASTTGIGQTLLARSVRPLQPVSKITGGTIEYWVKWPEEAKRVYLGNKALGRHES